MQFFMGIVPPHDYQQKVLSFMKKFNPRYEAPHVTVKAQSGLTPDKRWLKDVEHELKKFPKFEVALGEPRYLGDLVLYLSVNSSEIYQLHNKLVDTVNPPKDLIKRYFELDDFIPHLTLAQVHHGFSLSDLKEIGKLAEIDLQPYPTFEVTFIRLYCQEKEGEPYLKLIDIPLK